MKSCSTCFLQTFVTFQSLTRAETSPSLVTLAPPSHQSRSQVVSLLFEVRSVQTNGANVPFDFSLLENVLRLTRSILINQRLDVIYDPLLRSLASQRWFSSHQEDSTPWWSCTSPPLWSWRSVRSVCDGSCGSSPHVHHPVTEDAETRQPSLCLLS